MTGNSATRRQSRNPPRRRNVWQIALAALGVVLLGTINLWWRQLTPQVPDSAPPPTETAAPRSTGDPLRDAEARLAKARGSLNETIAALAVRDAATPSPDSLWRTLPVDIELLPRLEAVMDRASLDFSADGRWLVGAWADGFRVFDTATLTRVAWVPAPKLESVGFAYGRRAIRAKRAGVVEMWTFTEIGEWLRFDPPIDAANESFANGSSAVSPRFVALASPERYRVVESETQREVAAFPTENPGIQRNISAFSPDGKILALAIARRRVRLISTETWQPLADLTPPQPLDLDALAFSPDGRTLALASTDGHAELWRLKIVTEAAGLCGLVQPPSFENAEWKTAPLSAQPRPKWMEDWLPFTGGPGQIDLTPFFNARLDMTWSEFVQRGNDLCELPHGLQRLHGVEYDVRGIVQIAGAGMRAKEWSHYPGEISGIPVGRICKRLHFLHASVTSVPPVGARVATYRIRYADGTMAEMPVRYGWELCDWWTQLPETVESPAACIAWTGRNSAIREATRNDDVHLYAATWTNPRPAEPIAKIDLASAMSPAAAFIIAISNDEAE